MAVVATLVRLRARGVGFRSLPEPYIDTTTLMGEAMFAISAAWAQIERGINSERVRSGMARARAEGRRLGRPAVEVDVGLVAQLSASGMSWAKIALAHPRVLKPGGKRGKPGVGTLRRAYHHKAGELVDACQ